MENKNRNVMKEVAKQMENIEIEANRKRDRERTSSEEANEEIEEKICKGMAEYSGPDQNASPPQVDDCKAENVTNFSKIPQDAVTLCLFSTLKYTSCPVRSTLRLGLNIGFSSCPIGLVC